MLGGSRLFGGRRGDATASRDMANVNSMMGGPMMGMGPLTKKKKYKN